jgi:hypothetical protein
MYTKEEVLEFYKSALKEAGLAEDISNPRFEEFELEYNSVMDFCSILLEGVTNLLDNGEVEQIGVDEITSHRKENWKLTQI